MRMKPSIKLIVIIFSIKFKIVEYRWVDNALIKAFSLIRVLMFVNNNR